MGKMKVPATAYYGASTARAVENFQISSIRFGRRFIQALGLIKGAGAQVNETLGLVDGKIAGAIKQAAGEVASGDHDEQFVLDIFQTGS
ncbi:MAG TPA: lyase family protein, partial [Actinomycetota bacterium]|nr:lyase family protein [Actinomycetota bacterium]